MGLEFHCSNLDAARKITVRCKICRKNWELEL